MNTDAEANAQSQPACKRREFPGFSNGGSGPGSKDLSHL